MKIPRRIKIGPHRYRVNTDKAEHDRICRTEGDDLLGHCNTGRLLISVDPDAQHPSQLRDTVLHEVIHALADLTGLAHEWPDDQEEEIVRRLTPALLDTLRRNPKLVAYLTDKETP